MAKKLSAYLTSSHDIRKVQTRVQTLIDQDRPLGHTIVKFLEIQGLSPAHINYLGGPVLILAPNISSTRPDHPPSQLINSIRQRRLDLVLQEASEGWIGDFATGQEVKAFFFYSPALLRELEPLTDLPPLFQRQAYKLRAGIRKDVARRFRKHRLDPSLPAPPGPVLPAVSLEQMRFLTVPGSVRAREQRGNHELYIQ